jgi:hypothetical protein
MRRRLAAAAGVLTLAASVVIGLSATATAHPLNLRTATDGVQQVTVGTAGELLPVVVDRLAPGSSVTARFEVHRGRQQVGGRFASGITAVQDLENGCLHPEAADGDHSCGHAVGQGELSRQLLVTQAWSAPSPDCASAPPASDGPTLADASDALVASDPTVSIGDTACLAFTVELPYAADNLVQSDSSRFALRLGLVDAGREGDFTGGGGGVVSGLGAGQLPSTGLDAAARLAVAALMLLAGTSLVLLGRQRPSP